MITRSKLVWFLLFAALLVVFGEDGQAQVTYSVVIPARPPGGVGGACNSATIAYLAPTGGGNSELVVCTANVWTVSGGGGGGGNCPNSPVNSVLISDGTNCTNDNVFQDYGHIPAPSSAPPVAPTCTGTCATTYGYKTYYWNAVGWTTLSPEQTVVNAATLDGTHFNTITLPAHPMDPGIDLNFYCAVVRTTGPNSPLIVVNTQSTCTQTVVDNQPGLYAGQAPILGLPGANCTLGVFIDWIGVSGCNGGTFNATFGLNVPFGTSGINYVDPFGNVISQGGASPAGTNGNLQTKASASAFGASTITGGTPGSTYGDSPTLTLTSNFTSLCNPIGFDAMFMWGQYLACAGFNSTNGSVGIVDISNPAIPRIVSTITSTTADNGAWLPFVFGKFLYFTSTGTIPDWETWDISNINTPVHVNTIVTPDSSPPYGAVVTDSKVFLATSVNATTGHLYAYDLTTRTAPQLLNTLNLDHGGNSCGRPHCMLIRGGLLYTLLTGDVEGFEIVNVSNPSAMFKVSTTAFPDGATANLAGLGIDGDYFYVAAGSGGTCVPATGSGCALRIYNIKDPTAPTLVFAGLDLSTYFIQDLQLYNKFLYVAESNALSGTCPSQCELQVYDVTNPLVPVAVAGVHDANGIFGLAVLGKRLAVLDNMSNFYLYELPGISLPSIEAGTVKAGDVQSNGDVRGEGMGYFATGMKAGPMGVGSQGPLAGTYVENAISAVTFSSTPTFTMPLGDQFITLTGNVSSSTLVGLTPGQRVTFAICQDSMGSRTFVWPTSVKGAMTIGATASKCSVQEFESPDGISLYALNAGVINQ